MSGYIGNIPVPQATQTRDVFTASAGQTSFATSGYTPGFVDVYLNGVKLVDGTDFTATNGSDVVLASGAATSDTVEVVSYSTYEVNNQAFTGDFSVDGTTFKVDSTNNRVGVGTSSPATALDVSGTVTATAFSGPLTGNASTATKLETARTISLGGDVSGSASFDGSANITITATVADDSHNHIISNVDGLQIALDAKAPLASPALTGTPTAPTAAAGTNTTQIATTAFVGTAVSNLVASAPSTLDTLNELAAALGDDPNFATTVSNNIGTKVAKAGDTMTGNLTFNSGADINLNSGSSINLGVSGQDNYVFAWAPQTNYGLTFNTLSTNPANGSYDFKDGTGTSIFVIPANSGNNNQFKYFGNTIFTDGYHPNADKWTTARTLSLSGDVTGSASFDGSANITITATVADDSHSHSISTITDEHRLFNNMGDNHSTQTDFNAISNFGARFVQGSTNGPGTGSSQFYGFTLGLGNEYPLSQYALQLAIPRYISTDKYLSLRTREGGTWSSWTKISAGQADKWTTARTLSLTGAVTGSASIDGSGNVSLATTATSDPTLTLSGDATGSATFTNLGNATLTVTVVDDSHNHIIGNVDGLQTALDSKITLNTAATWSPASGTQLTFLSQDIMETASGDQASLEVYQDTAGADAFMQFHVSGDYAAYFGLKGDINDFAVGGWSMGSNYYRVWHQGNDGAGSGLDADLLDGNHASAFATASHTHNYAGSASSGGAAYDANAVAYTGYGSGEFTAYQTSGTWQTWTGGWATHLIGNHGDGQTYYNQTIIMPFWGAPQYMRKEGGVNKGPYKFWTEENDGAGSGLDADLLDGQHGSYYQNASNLNAGTVPDARISGSYTAYVTNGSAKAWVNFNGSGTVAIRDSLNVSSLTDNGTAQYTLGFSSSFASASYSPSAMNGSNNGGTANYPQENYTATASSIRGVYVTSSGTVLDPANAFFQSFGDLA